MSTLRQRTREADRTHILSIYRTYRADTASAIPPYDFGEGTTSWRDLESDHGSPILFSISRGEREMGSESVHRCSGAPRETGPSNEIGPMNWICLVRNVGLSLRRGAPSSHSYHKVVDWMAERSSVGASCCRLLHHRGSDQSTSED